MKQETKKKIKEGLGILLFATIFAALFVWLILTPPIQVVP